MWARSEVRALLETDTIVRTLCLPKANLEALDRLPFEIVTGNVLQRQSLAGVFTDCDAVIHLAAVISIAGDSQSDRHSRSARLSRARRVQ